MMQEQLENHHLPTTSSYWEGWPSKSQTLTVTSLRPCFDESCISYAALNSKTNTVIWRSVQASGMYVTMLHRTCSDAKTTTRLSKFVYSMSWTLSWNGVGLETWDQDQTQHTKILLLHEQHSNRNSWNILHHVLSRGSVEDKMLEGSSHSFPV